MSDDQKRKVIDALVSLTALIDCGRIEVNVGAILLHRLANIVGDYKWVSEFGVASSRAAPFVP